MTETKEIITQETTTPAIQQSIFSSMTAFTDGQRMANMLASSDLVPKQFQGNIANTVIALEMAQRMGASPLAVMQSIYIVHGKPSWAATFIIACINSAGRFSPLKFAMAGAGDKQTCVAWAYDLEDRERLEGPPVSIEMAKNEGWYQKNGSKWKTMPELMLRYRAATFFGRLYAPDVLMGMRSQDELDDIGPTQDDKPFIKPVIEPLISEQTAAGSKHDQENNAAPPQGKEPLISEQIEAEPAKDEKLHINI